LKTDRKNSLRLAAGVAIAALTAWLAFRSTDWAELAATFRSAGWGYTIAVLPFLAGSYFLRVSRWTTLLAPIRPVSKSHAFSPLITGFMLNSIFPGRIGEFARSALLSRKTGIPFPSSFATVVLARLFDGLTLTGMALIVMAAMWKQLAPAVRSGLLVAGLGYLAVLFLLAALKKWHGRTAAFIVLPLRRTGLSKPAEWVEKVLMSFAEGLDVLTDPGELFKTTLFSIGVWLMLCISVVPVFMALGIQWSWYYPPLILVLAGLGMLIPTPAGTGTIHYVLGVVFPAIVGISEPEAKAMAILFHGTQFIPVIIAGLVVSRGHLHTDIAQEPVPPGEASIR
jgi:glycosyltransferase 2 family protein